MRRAFRRASLALAAAGALGVTQTAWADKAVVSASMPLVVGEVMTAPVTVAEGGEHVESVEGRERFLALKAELALLADSVTFPYRITAEVTGEGLTLKGYILSEGVRRRILEVAHKATGLGINDNLHIQPSLVLPAAGISEGELQTHVLALLKKEFPERGRFFGVDVGPHGRVTLTGSIPSYEEKVAVSRCLRKAEGCQAVVNKLQVPTVFKKGRFFAMLSVDGQEMVAVEALGEEAPQHLPVVPSEDKQMHAGHPVALGPIVPPLTGPVVKEKPWQQEGGNSVPQPGEAVGSSPFSVAKVSGNGDGNTSGVGPSPFPDNSVPAGKQGESSWAPHPEILPPSVHNLPPGVTEAVSQPGSAPSPPPEIKTARPLPPGSALAKSNSFGPADSEPLPIAPSTTVPAPLPASTWSQSGNAGTAASRPGTASSGPMNNSLLGTGIPTDPGIVPMSPPAKPWWALLPKTGSAGQPPAVASTANTGPGTDAQPAASPPPKKANRFVPYVTTGVVTISEEEEDAIPPGKIIPGSLQDRLTGLVRAACGSKAQEVDVIVRSPKNLLVRLRIFNKTDAEGLSKKVLALPDLGPFQIDLEVRLARKGAEAANSGPLNRTLPGPAAPTDPGVSLASQPGTPAGPSVSKTGSPGQPQMVVSAASSGPVTAFPSAVPAPPKKPNKFVPYVTTGMVEMSEEEAEAAPPGKVIPGSLQDRLTRLVKTACGTKTQEVEVIVRSPKNLLVRLRIFTKADAESLSRKVLNLPELSSYQVDLEVRMARQ